MELKLEIKFNDIRLLKGTKNSILSIEEYISNGKNLKTKPIDSIFKNKRIAYCLELPFGIISSFRYVILKQ